MTASLREAMKEPLVVLDHVPEAVGAKEAQVGLARGARQQLHEARFE